MKKEDYFNSITHQVEDLRELCGVQADLCFDLGKLEKVMDRKTAAGIRRVILTGCGDSYSAAGAMLKGFRKLSGLKKVNAPDIMDLCAFYSDARLRKGYSPEEVLVVAISFSGSAERLAVALNKAADHGLDSMLITRTPDSRGGRAAKRIFNVETPDGCNSPGLRSYFASMMGLTALAAYIGVCRGVLDEAGFYSLKGEVVSYVQSFLEDLPRIEEQMFEEAIRMKDLSKFELIADANEGFSAQFVEQKFIECGGVYCDHTTSEEFAHISYFLRAPEEVGTIVMINEADLSLSRMKDTINGCLAQHRPTLIVTDLPEEAFRMEKKEGEEPDNIYGIADSGYDSMAAAGTASVCRIVKAPEQWMSPLVDFIPGSLLAAYQAAVREHNFFNGRYDFRTETWVS